MQKPKTTECPYPVRVTAPEKNAARAESDRVRCGKMLGEKSYLAVVKT